MKRPPVFLQSGGSCLSTIVLTISPTKVDSELFLFMLRLFSAGDFPAHSRACLSRKEKEIGAGCIQKLKIKW